MGSTQASAPPLTRSSGEDEGVEPVGEIKPIRISIKGRGTAHSPQGRFETIGREAVDDGWQDASETDADGAPRLRTEVSLETAKSIISRNQSPDLAFSQSINPYRGCEHGCIYCFARPTHAYLGLSPGLDFETKLFAKPNAAELLRKELAAPRYVCELIAMGTNTDPYQPIERKFGITREIIEVLAECNHPLGIVTKSSLIERDIDLLAPMAAKGLVQVFFSVTSLDNEVARRLDPRANAPARRLQAIAALAAAGIPVGVLASPVIPLITDMEFEAVLAAAREAGATRAGYSVLRLPHEVSGLFQDWLQRHYPLRAEHVMSQLRQMRGGRDTDSNFGSRMKGEGIFAELIRKRFDVACRRLGFDLSKRMQIDTSQFRAPEAPPAAPKQRKPTPQLDLF
jgi:DNA repair photolyase